jgi:hypothetical protein
MNGDFESPTFADSDADATEVVGGSRARRGATYLTADGNALTDLWVFDFVGGECVQSLHQVSTDVDWGQPQMSLTYGSHHVYFTASRGTEPTVDATAHTITWTRPSDTFWKDYSVDVVSTSNGNRAVTLDRVVTKLKVTITDEIPGTMATLTLTPAMWYYGVNYLTGEPSGASSIHARSVTVPASYIGTTGTLSMSIFGFSSATEWTTDVVVTAKDGDGAAVGTATISDAAFKCNRISEYSGPLFGSAGTATVSVNDEWLESITGTW